MADRPSQRLPRPGGSRTGIRQAGAGIGPELTVSWASGAWNRSGDEITAWRSRKKKLSCLERIRRRHKFRRSSPSHQTVANYLSPEEGADVVDGASEACRRLS